MLYLLAILFPPAAVLLSGKPIEAVLNVVLTLLFWVPGVIHAMLVVSSHQADVRTGRVVKAMRQESRTVAMATAGASDSERALETGRAIVGRDGRVACPDCGYRNSRSRKLCKGCRAELA